MIGFALLVAIADPVGELEQQIKRDPFMGAYVLCIAKKAGDLETSGESAESVATAAVLACDEAANFAAEMEILKFDGEGQRKGQPALTDDERTKLKAETLKMFREKAHALAITRVVAKRAER